MKLAKNFAAIRGRLRGARKEKRAEKKRKGVEPEQGKSRLQLLRDPELHNKNPRGIRGPATDEKAIFILGDYAKQSARNPVKNEGTNSSFV